MEIKGSGWWRRCEDYVYQHEVIDRVVLRDCHTVQLVTAMCPKNIVMATTDGFVEGRVRGDHHHHGRIP